MDRYILNGNKQDSDSGENYEIHNLDADCGHLPDRDNMNYLGRFNDCEDAMMAAKIAYPRIASAIDGCYYCCEDCHDE